MTIDRDDLYFTLHQALVDRMVTALTPLRREVNRHRPSFQPALHLAAVARCQAAAAPWYARVERLRRRWVREVPVTSAAI